MAAAPQRNKQLPKPIDFDQLYPGRFLKSGELLGEKRTVTIERVEIDELENEKGKKIQGVLHLKDEKQIALNKTNGLCLKGMFGKKLSEWEGKRITIYQDSVQFGANMVDAIRIWGSPDIAKDIEVIINLPKKRPYTMTMRKVMFGQAQPARANTDANAPTAADYESCTERAAFDALEKRRAAVWRTMPPNEAKDALKKAADAAKARFDAGTAPAQTSAQSDLVGKQQPEITEEAAIEALRACKADGERDATWKDIYKLFGGNVPLSVEAVNHEMREQLTI